MLWQGGGGDRTSGDEQAARDFYAPTRGCSSWRTTVNQRTIGLHDAVIKEVRLQEKTAVSVTFCCGKKVMAVEEARPESDGC